VLTVTHDPAVAEAIGRTVAIRDGRVSTAGVVGSESLVIGRDGSVLLPPDVLRDIPPGSRIRAVRTPGGVELRWDQL
jgi:hypothetical protein